MRKLGSVGTPMLNVEARVVDDEMNDVARVRSVRSCTGRRW
jgi:fatty-acyl-CoA synthase